MLTFKSEMVLNDCKIALEQLKIVEQKDDVALLRLSWLTCVVLLRSVGYILKQIDEKSADIQLKPIFKSVFEKYRNDLIYMEFIEKDRHLMLKEYKFMFHLEETEKVKDISMAFQDGTQMLFQDGSEMLFNTSERIKRYFLKTGTFDEKEILSDVVQKAIYWWETYIDDLKVEINKVT